MSAIAIDQSSPRFMTSARRGAGQYAPAMSVVGNPSDDSVVVSLLSNRRAAIFVADIGEVIGFVHVELRETQSVPVYWGYDLEWTEVEERLVRCSRCRTFELRGHQQC